MQAIDIGILIILALPTLVGVMYGFLNILFSIIAWILAIGIAAKFGSFFSPMLADYVDTVLIRDMLAFSGLFIVSLMLLTLLGYFIVKLLGRTGLTGADRILGLFFGMGLGIVIVSVIVFLAGFTALPEAPWWRSAILLEPFQHIAMWAHGFLPTNIAGYHGYTG